MGSKKTFINPLTRSSEEDLNILPASKSVRTAPKIGDLPAPDEYPSLRKRGSKAFEKTHERFTSWMDKQLKKQLERLAHDEGVSKTSLLNEAIVDLLKKHMQK